MKFRPTPGTITCADYPAPISGAGVCNMPMVVATATGATAKMVACADPPLRDKALGIADVHAYGGWIFNGINQHGQFFMAMHSGMAPGAIPASPGRDGIDTGGQDWVPGMEASNVEDNEMSWPVLTLFRRENRADAAGAGRYRSGVAAEEAWILHGSDIVLDTQVYNNESFVKCQGLLGGNPGGRAFFRVKRDSDVRARLAAGTIPQSVDEVAGEEIPLYWKGGPVELDKTAVWTLNLPNFAGYGDPLDRDPAAVGRDLSEGQMTTGDAFDVYGVVVAEDGTIDEEKTAKERADRRRRRLQDSLPPHEARGLVEPGAASERRAIGDKLGALRTADGDRYACTCGQDLGPVEADLLIAGHTHGGQVRLPLIGPLLNLSRVPRGWIAGATTLAPGRTLIVSRGIGMERANAPRLRFLCRPELVVIDLVPSE